MFTGIIETTARVVNIEKENTNYHFTLEVPFGDELAIDQSMAHDGCCLTVVKVDKAKKQYVVTAMDETMLKTNLSTWQVGTEVNVERSLRRRRQRLVALLFRIRYQERPQHHRAQRLDQHQRRQPDGGRFGTRYVQRGYHPLYLQGD